MIIVKYLLIHINRNKHLFFSLLLCSIINSKKERIVTEIHGKNHKHFLYCVSEPL